MSESQSRADELGDLFVSVTGDDAVTERQTEESSDRESDGTEVDVEDGLDDAVDGAELGDVGVDNG